MIIGICGWAGTGKDTAANYLVGWHGFRRDSFAGALKDAVAAVFGWDRELLEGSTPESNSGALIHLQPPFNKIFPPSLEPQGRYKDHGKIFPMAGVKAENNKFDQEALDKALKPLGQWNSTEITCKADGSVSVKVNGTPVSSCTSKLKEGPVGFQSEGHEIHLKNIHLKPLD